MSVDIPDSNPQQMHGVASPEVQAVTAHEARQEREQTFELSPDTTFSLDLNEIQALDPVDVIRNAAEGDETMSVRPLALLSSENSTMALFYRRDGDLLISRLERQDDGRYKVIESTRQQNGINGYTSSTCEWDDGTSVTVTRYQTSPSQRRKEPDVVRMDKVSLHYTGESPVDARADAGASIVDDRDGIDPLKTEVKKAKKTNDRIRNLISVKNVVGGFLVARSILLPGGAIDDVLDRFHHASNSLGGEMQGDVDPDTVMDGVRVGDHPDWLADEQEIVDEHNSAVERVRTVMGALDEHDDARVQELAGEFKEAYGDQLIGEERVNEILRDIESSDSASATIRIIGDFLRFYDKEVGFYEDNTIDSFNNNDLKGTARNIIAAYQLLPRDLLASARFDSVLLTEPEHGIAGSALSSIAGAAAMYTGYDLVINVNDAVTRTGREAHDFMVPDRFENAEQVRIILHETGHSMDDELHDELFYSDRSDEEEQKMNFSPSFFLTYIIGHPNRSTFYGSGMEREDYADTVSHVLDPEFIDHPDFVRFFTSEASEREMRILIQLEEEYPGITAYLYEAKLENDDHDSQQIREVVIAAILLAIRPKITPRKPRKELMAT